MFRKIVYSLVFVWVLLTLTTEAKKKDDLKKGIKKDKECGEWVYESCILTNKTSTCGVGLQVANRNGSSCKKLTKEVPCKIKCPKSPSKKCKYGGAIVSSDSKCDPTTGTMQVTKNLLSGGPTCQQSIFLNKKCRIPKNKDNIKNKKANKKSKQEKKIKKEIKENKAKIDEKKEKSKISKENHKFKNKKSQKEPKKKNPSDKINPAPNKSISANGKFHTSAKL